MQHSNGRRSSAENRRRQTPLVRGSVTALMVAGLVLAAFAAPAKLPPLPRMFSADAAGVRAADYGDLLRGSERPPSPPPPPPRAIGTLADDHAAKSQLLVSAETLEGSDSAKSSPPVALTISRAPARAPDSRLLFASDASRTRGQPPQS